ncbi:hypothetical protein Fmac_019837 [Flemingia macrophylla]|uniref:Uncharacterized protein n=1 Tax=Flemingia macrophylla TaxID=520843 RepID=A0ABD1M8Y5_9FABA
MMELRSKSCRDDRLQTESKVAPRSMEDLRCYSANNASYAYAYAYAYAHHHNHIGKNKDVRVKKGKNTASAKPSKTWSLSDPELQRKKRVAGYKVYAAEAKMKGSLRKSFTWIKNAVAVYGWW